MKSIILIFLAMTFCTENKEANEKFVTICKVANDMLRVDYLDSTHGIISVEDVAKNDTLLLKINVGKGKPKKSFEVKFSEKIKFISTGISVYDLNKIEQCKKVYSGEDALEQLKKQQLK